MAEKPLIIIYLVCPKQDVMSRCEYLRMDPSSNNQNIIDANEFTRPFDDELDTLYDFSPIANELIKDNNRRSVRHTFEMRCDLHERLALPVDKWILSM